MRKVKKCFNLGLENNQGRILSSLRNTIYSTTMALARRTQSLKTISDNNLNFYCAAYKKDKITLSEQQLRVEILEHFMGAEDLSRIKSSPARAAGGRLNSTQVFSPKNIYG